MDLTVTMWKLLQILPIGGSTKIYACCKLNSYRTIEKAYIARVDGQIYSTFSALIPEWQKRLVLVKFRGDPTFRMFLNGARNVVGSFTQEWFLDRKVNPLAERLEGPRE